MSFSLCDEIKLISLVAENSCLYDSHSKEFRSGGCRTKAWQRIAAQLNKRADHCKNVWTKIRRQYSQAVYNSRLGIRSPASWKSKHHEILSSFLPVQRQQGRQPVESLDNELEAKDLQQNSSRIEWVDWDLNIVEPPKRYSVQNGVRYVEPGGQSLKQETADLEEQGHSMSAKTADDWWNVELGEQAGQSLQIADNGLTERPSVAQEGQRVSQGHHVEKADKISSDCVRQNVATVRSVDNDIAAEIANEEQRLLQQYRLQQKNNKQKRGGGGGRKSNVSAKKRRVPNTAQKRVKNEAAKVVVDDVDESSMEDEGTQMGRNSSVGNQTSRRSKDGGMQGPKVGHILKRNVGSRQSSRAYTRQNPSRGGNNVRLGSSDQHNSSQNGNNVGLGSSDQHNSSQSGKNVGLGSSDQHNSSQSGNNVGLGSPDQRSVKNNLRLGLHNEQSLLQSRGPPQVHSDNSCDDVDLFCRHMGLVLRSLNPLQKAEAKKELSSVLSNYEIVAAKNVAGHTGLGIAAGCNVVTTTRMEGLSFVGAGPPRISLMGGHM